MKRGNSTLKLMLLYPNSHCWCCIWTWLHYFCREFLLTPFHVISIPPKNIRKPDFWTLVRGVATGVARGAWPSHFSFQTTQGPTVSVSNIRQLLLIDVQKLCGPEIPRFSPCMLQFFWKYAAASHFFKLHKGNGSLYGGLPEKVPYLTLDLLKILSLWTIWKKNTMNESWNV